MSRAFLKKANDEFIPLEDGATMKKGVRITFMRGFPALYAEALKNSCYVKNIPIHRVHHPSMGKDKKTGEDRQKRLFELTAQTSLPVIWYNEERVRSAWSEQLALVERIGNGASLIPNDVDLGIEMFGICAILLGEDGLVWNNRIQSDRALGRKYVCIYDVILFLSNIYIIFPNNNYIIYFFLTII